MQRGLNSRFQVIREGQQRDQLKAAPKDWATCVGTTGAEQQTGARVTSSRLLSLPVPQFPHLRMVLE